VQKTASYSHLAPLLAVHPFDKLTTDKLHFTLSQHIRRLGRPGQVGCTGFQMNIQYII
jgi:hypothetical protein